MLKVTWLPPICSLADRKLVVVLYKNSIVGIMNIFILTGTMASLWFWPDHFSATVQVKIKFPFRIRRTLVVLS